MVDVRAKTNEMATEAVRKLGPSITEHLTGIPADQQIDVLIKLTGCLACMATAIHRIHHPHSNPFYDEAREMVVSMLVDLLPLPRGEDFKVEFSPEAQAQMAADPDLAEAVPDILAQIRQALDGVATGKFSDVAEAMESIGAKGFMMVPDDDKETLQ